jgi:hypothetical protein
MFQDTYKKIYQTLTRNNRRQNQKLSESILKKGISSSKLSVKEKNLLGKLKNWIDRSCFDFDYTVEELLLDMKDSLTNRECQKSTQAFVTAATRQSVSERAQLETMKSRGFSVEKLSAQGKKSLRFNQDSSQLNAIKTDGETSKSLDYRRSYSGFEEYFLGKVCYGQGGHQNNVKEEIIDFLKRSNSFLDQNPNSDYIFTALIDGDALSEKDMLEYNKYCSPRVRLMSCDTYESFSE